MAQAANSTHSLPNLAVTGFTKKADSMQDIHADLLKPMPSIVPSCIPTLSDEECLQRLAKFIAAHDSHDLDEVVRLIGRLAVTIE